jgi:ribosomal protein S18 acetylase RimI-like enzyme
MPDPRPALPDELPRAFELLFGRLSASERAYRVSRALELVAQGELDAQGVLVLPTDQGPIGVFVCQKVPGAGGLVWPPAVLGEEVSALEDRLVLQGCDWLRCQGVRVAQCLLSEEEALLSPSLLRNSFQHVTGLTYLRHHLILDAGHLAGPARLTFAGYDAAGPAEFHQTLLRTYEQTLDCPEVNGVRTIDDVIQGHQAQGRYDPAHWWLARLDGKPVGVLLIVEPSPGEWEVVYMGIVPEGRRRGLGHELLLHALCEARAAGMERVVLSVDDRNIPARRLYERVGFEVYDHRRVLLAVW